MLKKLFNSVVAVLGCINCCCYGQPVPKEYLTPPAFDYYVFSIRECEHNRSNKPCSYRYKWFHVSKIDPVEKDNIFKITISTGYFDFDIGSTITYVYNIHDSTVIAGSNKYKLFPPSLKKGVEWEDDYFKYKLIELYKTNINNSDVDCMSINMENKDSEGNNYTANWGNGVGLTRLYVNNKQFDQEYILIKSTYWSKEEGPDR